MLSKSKEEEQFPLLLLLVGDGTKDLSRSNRRFFGRRFDGITSGASAVITEWPNNINPCWVTTTVCAITLFIVSLLLLAILSPPPPLRLPRCTNSNYQLDNQTIHLVQDFKNWSPYELEVLEAIAESFPTCRIHLIIIKNDQIFSDNSKPTVEPITRTASNETDGLKKSLIFNAIFGEKPKPLESLIEFLAKHPNVLVSHQSYRTIFEESPLYWKWMMLDRKSRVFAVRILQLWQYGGLSFDLQQPKGHNSTTIKQFIKSSREGFGTLGERAVLIDKGGLHMSASIPCHAFFGRVLMKLRKTNGYVAVTKILREVMLTYCNMNAIKGDNCDHIKY